MLEEADEELGPLADWGKYLNNQTIFCVCFKNFGDTSSRMRMGRHRRVHARLLRVWGVMGDVSQWKKPNKIQTRTYGYHIVDGRVGITWKMQTKWSWASMVIVCRINRGRVRCFVGWSVAALLHWVNKRLMKLFVYLVVFLVFVKTKIFVLSMR